VSVNELSTALVLNAYIEPMDGFQAERPRMGWSLRYTMKPAARK
jgi:hypothetical protein